MVDHTFLGPLYLQLMVTQHLITGILGMCMNNIEIIINLSVERCSNLVVKGTKVDFTSCEHCYL
jgi:hypothetical protein